MSYLYFNNRKGADAMTKFIIVIVIISFIGTSIFFYIKKDATNIKKEFYSNGKIKSETSYKGSLKNGAEKLYYENGSLKKERSYINDTLNGEYINYNIDRSVDSKGFFWKGKACGPIYYFENNQLVLYNERDYNGIVYYVKKFDSTGKLIKEDGVAISPNFYTNSLKDSLPINTLVQIYFFYAEPDNYLNLLEGFVNGKQVQLIKSEPHICFLQEKIEQRGKYEFHLTSTLMNNGTMVNKQSFDKIIYSY